MKTNKKSNIKNNTATKTKKVIKTSNKVSFTKNKIKLKNIKNVKAFNSFISNIYFFKNKNYLVLSNKNYKIYNDKYNNIKTNQKEDWKLSNIKIVDTNNFMCLLNNKVLINITIKDGKYRTLFNINEEIFKIIYYKNNILINYNKYINSGIKIWVLISNENTKIYQLKAKFLLPQINYNNKSNIFLVKNKNKDILVSSSSTGEDYLYFWNLNIYKFEYKLEIYCNSDFCCQKNENEIILVERDDIFSHEIAVFNITEKKFMKKKDLKHVICSIIYLVKKNLVLIAGGPDLGFEKNIYIYDDNFNQKQILEKIIGDEIIGLTLYKRSEDINGNDDFIISYSNNGTLNFFEFC